MTLDSSSSRRIAPSGMPFRNRATGKLNEPGLRVSVHFASVAMESTASYWKPLINIFEASGLDTMVVNARHIGNTSAQVLIVVIGIDVVRFATDKGAAFG